MCVCGGGGYSHIVWVGCAAGFAKVLPFRDVSLFSGEGGPLFWGGGSFFSLLSGGGPHFFQDFLGEGHNFLKYFY